MNCAQSNKNFMSQDKNDIFTNGADINTKTKVNSNDDKNAKNISINSNTSINEN